MSNRRRVLNLYKRILLAAANWQAKSEIAEESLNEKSFIINEARTLFKMNKNITNSEEIEMKLKEGEARLEIGVHYKNPYPRPVYAPPGTMAAIDDRKKKIYKEKLRTEGKPVYIQSIRDE